MHSDQIGVNLRLPPSLLRSLSEIFISSSCTLHLSLSLSLLLVLWATPSLSLLFFFFFFYGLRPLSLSLFLLSLPSISPSRKPKPSTPQTSTPCYALIPCTPSLHRPPMNASSLLWATVKPFVSPLSLCLCLSYSLWAPPLPSRAKVCVSLFVHTHPPYPASGSRVWNRCTARKNECPLLYLSCFNCTGPVITVMVATYTRRSTQHMELERFLKTNCPCPSR